jgi:serine/threonine-protein kinase
MTPTSLDNHRYRIICTLGSGGFGDTFLAEDTQMPSKRRCVIKQLRPVNNNPKIYQLVQDRFQREAAVLEELGKGNRQIPQLFASFIEDGEFYLIQEWIEGETLSQKITKFGRLSESAVKEILINILPVLDYVHSQRIVHRDIKPDNIILRNQDNQPVLIDFGAVREAMGTVMTTGGNATSSIVIGTPGYMPSEQSAGRPVFSSDLYSLGLTAIYLLTGKVPQELETDHNSGEIIWQHHVLNVSSGFKAIIDKAIQSHPRDRYPTAKDMLNALRSGFAETFIPVSPPPVIPNPVPSDKSLSDWQKAIIMCGVIGGCVVGFLWITKANSPDPKPEKSLTEKGFSPSSTPISSDAKPQSSETTKKVPPEPIAQPSQAPNPVPYQTQYVAPPTNPISNTQPNYFRSRGWIRLGAVNNTSGTASVGQTLITTNQPVTISPSVVPSINDKVILITGVNLRITQPQKPTYKLGEKIAELLKGQQLVILQLDTFTDPNSNSRYTVVWAEVGLP